MILLKNFLITVIAITCLSCSTRNTDTIDFLFERSVSIPYKVLVNIADYIDTYPAASSLFDDIRDKDWIIAYKPDAMVTVSRYAMSHLSSVIYFDYSVGAVMGEGEDQGVASPTDALLHEMLHVREITPRLMINRGKKYPLRHELAVISLERQLYRSMDSVDDRKRPQRYTHSGTTFRATCVTCNY